MQVTHPSKGNMGVIMSSLLQSTVFLRMFSIKSFISGDNASYFLGMIML